MNKYRIENPNNNIVREYKSRTTELIDMQGRIVKTAKLKAKQGNRIDVSSLSAGAYTYNVSLNGKTISGKIIIGK